MRNNRRARNFNEETETKKLIYISIAVVILAILTFVITYVVYSNVLNKNSGDITQKITDIGTQTEGTLSEASSPIGKNVNEVKQEQENTEKIAVNTTNLEKQTENKTNETVETKAQEEKKEETKKEEIKDPTFAKPVEGDIIKEFASENLIYSETLKEWVTHNGIDIKAEKATIVKASSEGTIKSIKNDPRYGITIVIEHTNGYVSVYSNLLTAEFVKEGEKVKQGQTIGTVGNTAAFEIADDPHLHFEILKDNKYINPSEYIK
ncbi:MAG: M23 family metallopeptidase [Clostridia bacterium]|nr:M23 family metallopeptidase [Clostridia bacterium]